MKKLAVLFMVVMVVLSFAACGNGDIDSIDKSDGLSAEECYLGVINSKSADEMSEYIYGDNAEEYYDKVEELFSGDSFKVDAEHAGQYKDYEVYCMTVKSKTDKSKQMSNFELFKEENGSYYLVLDSDILNEVNRECKCPTCDGSGAATVGGNACAICAGTGVQYYPNAYFDAGTGMWMGETRACSGCGGAGYFGGSSASCHTCDGRRYVFDK